MAKIIVHHSGITWSAHCVGSPIPEVSGTNKSAVKALAQAMCRGKNIVINEDFLDYKIAINISAKAAEFIKIDHNCG